ncbi:unnamed protein product [Nyctereutes procyonoides]|uniref:(raccoon dog) hypothetical protein n=1 Tax=Nyctereutes procyonoides TaxID=34880 RepID=A0A811ZWI2_NYCPR|nr:unnamed protein product [Nyctereutes procyonoides]
MGTSTFSEYPVIAHISVAKIDPLALLDKVCLLGCGISTEPGFPCATFSLGGVGLAAIMGCKVTGASQIMGLDTDKFSRVKKFGVSEWINPRTSRTGNLMVMRAAPVACHKGWGISVVVGVAASGEEIATRPFQLSVESVQKLVSEYMSKRFKLMNLSFELMHAGKCTQTILKL